MRIYENGVYRDATPEEEAAVPAAAEIPENELEARIAALEEELAAAKVLLGVDE